MNGSGDLLSHSPVHAGAWDREDYGGSTTARGGKTLTQIDLFFGATYGLDIYESHMVCSTSTINMGLEVYTT